MSVNTSLSSSYNFYHEMHNCLNTTVGALNITAFTITNILLLLPLYILVLYLGLQRWRQQRSGTTMSHFDAFTYHMVFMELISVLGSCLCCWGVHTNRRLVMMVAIYLSAIPMFGQMLFHNLTCVERYLAVVHPVTYRSLKEARGIRMRNVIIGCVWLLCVVRSVMSVNTSLLPSALSSSFNFYHEVHNCLNTTVSTTHITAFTITSILLLLPLYILVLYLGLQRWRQQRSGTTMSHSDVFTYHMVFIELISVLGSCLSCWGVHTDRLLVMMVGTCLSVINSIGQMLFHILTCVERYLAVVHPVTYRSLKEARGIRMRNASNMSDNSSSSSIVQFNYHFSNCFGSRTSNFIFTAFTVTNILLLLPLFVIILHLVHQRWRQQRSASASDSDFIAYHMVVMETIYSTGSVFYCIGAYVDLRKMMIVASHVVFITYCGQILFHTLTCVEHYLAVVHPITFMRLRKASGVTIRNVTIGSIWLLGFAEMCILVLNQVNYVILLYFGQQALSLTTISFCSFAVIRVLKRPGPGEGGGDRDRVDQSKKRAFNTIMAILLPLLVRFGGNIVCAGIYCSKYVSDRCVVIYSCFWFCLPSSLVSPLLLLHRAGKLPRCRTDTETGQRSS
ncbi:hypothetical protein D9C73_026916 [Collichthys lucidus]|uniref:G-protein coupled receptors family 1 profile domain-containing protein n=1 Tax=Collichthys lucidus TaxID=240159 RepID=A0A4U5VWA3_COLLU|nr:hypothetical protein D9C73_026916 [Collichthys lucidus]